MKNSSNIIIKSLAGMSLCLLMSCPVNARQDEQDNTPAFQFDRPVASRSEDIKLGDFIFHPDISFSQHYNDNIFATDTDQQDDAISQLRTELSLVSDWKQHAMSFKLGADASRYRTYSSENTVDDWLNLQARYELNKDNHISVTVGYIDDHEDRTSPEAVFGTEPVEFSERRIELGFDRSFNMHSLKLGVSSVQLDYHDVTTASGVLSNDSRDRADDSIGLRFNYAIKRDYYLFIQSLLETRDYEQAFDTNLFNRDSDIQSHMLGVKFKPSSQFYGELAGGRLSQKFDDNQFSNVSVADFSARINWHSSPNSLLHFRADRSPDETTLNNASSFIYDQFMVRFSQVVNKQWNGYLYAAQATADYQLIGREDDYRDYAVGMNFQPQKGLGFGMDLIRSQRESTEDAQDYRSNNIYLWVSARI